MGTDEGVTDESGAGGSVADELYGAPPSEFVARRREHVGRAKSAGDKALAAQLGKLTRPTTSAWLMNLLVRHERNQLDELLEVGAALRDAQSRLAGDTLRELSSRRRNLVADLVAAAGRLAADHDQAVSDSVGREIAETLDAATADPAAAEAVRSGRLTRSLSYAGFGPVDLTGSVAAGPTAAAATTAAAAATAPAPAPVKAASGTPPAEDRAPQNAERRRQEAIRAARETLAEAERRAAERRDHLDDHRSALQTAKDTFDAAVRHVKELEAELARTRRDQATAAAAVATAQRRLAKTERDSEQAERAASRARSDLRRREPGP